MIQYYLGPELYKDILSKIEKTPPVLADLILENITGINLVSSIACPEDTILVVQDGQIIKMIKIQKA